MKPLFFFVASLLGGLALPVFAVTNTPVEKPEAAAVSVPRPALTGDDPPGPPIREFAVETIAALGRDLFRVDQLAWVATDIVMAKVGIENLRKDGACGWVVDTSGAEPVVRFLRKPREILEAAYDIRFPENAEPVLEVPNDRALTARQLARHVARDTALAPFNEGRYPLCRLRPGNHFNYAVLDDPGGDGFLVYLLRPKESSDLVPVGGHYRISVSGDGKTVERVDALSRSCLTMDRTREIPDGATLMTMCVSHIVSNTPVETHVFLSLQEKLPFLVVTADGGTWEVDRGTIRKSHMKLPEPTPVPAKAE